MTSISRKGLPWRASSAVAAVIVAAIGFTVVPGEAADAMYRYRVVDKVYATYQTGEVISTCKAAASGTTCAISRGASASRTIGVAFGLSRGAIASQLNISTQKSQSVSVGCSSPAMQRGKTWKARSVGTRFVYKIRQEKAYRPRIGGRTKWRTVATSGFRVAFSPYSASISCGYR